MGEFLMPSLGADMERGTVLEWLVEPGDVVHKGDAVVVIDTDKSDIEAEVFQSGTVVELLVEEGTEVPVGTPLARIAGENEPAAVARAPDEVTAVARTPRQAPTTASTAGVVLSPLVRRLAEERHLDPATITGSGPGGRVTRADVTSASVPARPTSGPRDRPGAEGWIRSSPLARRRARQDGIDLTSLTGSGPSGAIVAADVERAPRDLALRDLAPRDRSERMRMSIADAMARSKREIPHYYLQTTIDLDDTMDWLRGHNESRPITERLLPAALLLRATAVAAAQHPELNGWWDGDGGHEPAEHVHLGVAISMRGGGLIAPGIPDADRLSATQLMAALRDLVQRARAGRLRQSEYTGPTITVTNLGDLGVESVYGVINPPQLAMVGFGAVHDAPVVAGDEVVAHPVVTATLAADHRASDGMRGAAFLDHLAGVLHDPARLEPPTRATPTQNRKEGSG